ncbi:hypothetical protein [Streptomyces sp. CAU 1734]|uniref:hypothetical protein n=1 Tax=Streptomyces sp. CAU 1734 TaxID=3140360 RepID=UPI003260EB71
MSNVTRRFRDDCHDVWEEFEPGKMRLVEWHDGTPSASYLETHTTEFVRQQFGPLTELRPDHVDHRILLADVFGRMACEVSEELTDDPIEAMVNGRLVTLFADAARRLRDEVAE